MKDVIKLKKKGEKALKNGCMSRKDPEKALSYFEDANKLLRILEATKLTRSMQVELLEKEAECWTLLNSNFKAGRRLEEALKIVRQNEGMESSKAIAMCTRAADLFTEAGNRSKACDTILCASKSLLSEKVKCPVESLMELVNKLVLICEEEPFPSHRDFLDKIINLLAREEFFDKALDVLRRESVLLSSETLNPMKWRNILSEIVLLLKMKRRDEAKKALESNTTTGFLDSNQYQFGSRLVKASQNLDNDELECLVTQGSG